MTGFGFSKKEIFSITTDKNNTNNINKSKRLTLMRTVLQGGVRDQVGFRGSSIKKRANIRIALLSLYPFHDEGDDIGKNNSFMEKSTVSHRNSRGILFLFLLPPGSNKKKTE